MVDLPCLQVSRKGYYVRILRAVCGLFQFTVLYVFLMG